VVECEGIDSIFSVHNLESRKATFQKLHKLTTTDPEELALLPGAEDTFHKMGSMFEGSTGRDAQRRATEDILFVRATRHSSASFKPVHVSGIRATSRWLTYRVDR
jgi:hypothetical protein